MNRDCKIKAAVNEYIFTFCETISKNFPEIQLEDLLQIDCKISKVDFEETYGKYLKELNRQKRLNSNKSKSINKKTEDDQIIEDDPIRYEDDPILYEEEIDEQSHFTSGDEEDENEDETDDEIVQIKSKKSSKKEKILNEPVPGPSGVKPSQYMENKKKFYDEENSDIEDKPSGKKSSKEKTSPNNNISDESSPSKEKSSRKKPSKKASTPKELCTYIFSKGEKKGTRCTSAAKIGNLCSKHSK